MNRKLALVFWLSALLAIACRSNAPAPSPQKFGGVYPQKAGDFWVNETAATPFAIKDGSGVSRVTFSTPHGATTMGGGGSDFKTVCGPMPSFETADSGCWALPTATTPTSANVLVYSDGTNGFINAMNAAGAVGFLASGNYLSKVQNISGGQVAQWLGVGTLFGANNWAVDGDAATFVALNAPTTSSIIELVFGNSQISMNFAGGTQNGVALGGTIATVGHMRTPSGFNWLARNSGNTANNVVMQDDGANNLSIGSGYATVALSSAGQMTGVAGGLIAWETPTDMYLDETTLHIRNGSHVESNTITPGALQMAFSNGVAFQTITITSARTLDTTTGDAIVYIDTSGGTVAVTLPTPTAGRWFTIVDKKNTFGTNSATLVRHATEKIDNVAATKTLNASGYRANVISDGTDWYTM